MRYFIRFSYLGKAYHGWQNQPNAITVQQVLEEALSTLLRKPIAIVGAGRTDAGVHAKEMYAHFDFETIKDLQTLIQRLNAYLPEDVAVYELVSVQNAAHARFDAVERTYEYWVVQQKNPFFKDFAHYVWSPLNVEAMNRAASILMEYDNFECFSKSNTDVKTFICDIKNARWNDSGDKKVFTITADRFLRNMVRAIVGTLLEVGQEKINPEDIRKIIESKSRSEAGASVPAKGLYLTQVVYPKTVFI
ncbi:tRNA pseudouridine(38-40) synthase TruA [Allomuricauda sp. d1]|uniref:tRNA pseudouridine(38-40) synthase TruA n=1 Tax=Allomuricauda sp. d1 TaxID=3136725 RepID=UPI0031DB86E3